MVNVLPEIKEAKMICKESNVISEQIKKEKKKKKRKMALEEKEKKIRSRSKSDLAMKSNSRSF